jgi:hypothetical protein
VQYFVLHIPKIRAHSTQWLLLLNLRRAAIYCHVYYWLITRVLDWMNGYIYSWYTPPVITRNYSAIAISTLYNSLSHTRGARAHACSRKHTHTHTHTSRLHVTELKHRNYNSLTELHTPKITPKVFSSQPHSCNRLFLHSRPYRTEFSTGHCTAPFHDGFVSLTHGFSAATSYDWLLDYSGTSYNSAARTKQKTPSIFLLQRNCLATSYNDIFSIAVCTRCRENVYGVVA